MVPHTVSADFVTALAKDSYAGKAGDDVISTELHFSRAVHLGTGQLSKWLDGESPCWFQGEQSASMFREEKPTPQTAVSSAMALGGLRRQ